MPKSAPASIRAALTSSRCSAGPQISRPVCSTRALDLISECQAASGLIDDESVIPGDLDVVPVLLDEIRHPVRRTLGTDDVNLVVLEREQDGIPDQVAVRGDGE